MAIITSAAVRGARAYLISPAERNSARINQKGSPMTTHAPQHNQLLASLPADEYQRLHPHLEMMPIKLGTTIQHPEEAMDWVYFPVTCAASMLATMQDGATVEAGVIGNEGLVGVSAMLGAQVSPFMTLIQVEGAAQRIRTDVLRREFLRGGTLQRRVLLYSHTLLTMVSQTAACNRLHLVEERLARWLLMTHDRVGSDEFELTQDFIARMLGVRRSGVTVAAGNLQRAELITYTRGRINITDRRGLEGASCECYELVRREYDRYLAA